MRLQRIPKNEKRGRVHSSTVTIAVIDPDERIDGVWAQRGEDDFRLEWFNGTTKAGGQHHQKNATCCRLIHIPSGLVQTSQGRSRKANEEEARARIGAELDRRAHEEHRQSVGAAKRQQVGSGMRGDKARTIRFQDDRVTHHESGRTMAATRFMRGHMDEIWR